jgi:hypothetical protein
MMSGPQLPNPGTEQGQQQLKFSMMTGEWLDAGLGALKRTQVSGIRFRTPWVYLTPEA